MSYQITGDGREITVRLIVGPIKSVLALFIRSKVFVAEVPTWFCGKRQLNAMQGVRYLCL